MNNVQKSKMNQFNQILELAIRYIAGLLDNLKVSNPLIYMIIIFLYAGGEAFLQTVDSVNGIEIGEQVKMILNYVLLFFAGITGSRTTRYIAKGDTNTPEEKIEKVALLKKEIERIEGKK